MNVRRSIATAAAVVGLPVMSLGLTSCGFDAPTDQVYNPAVGVNDQDGDVDALNVVVVSATDGSGALVASLANNDQTEDDRLTGVTGEGVEVELAGDEVIPAGGLVTLDDGSLAITGDAVRAGAFVTLTFTFDRAASLTLDAPVVVNDGPYADVPVS